MIYIFTFDNQRMKVIKCNLIYEHVYVIRKKGGFIRTQIDVNNKIYIGDWETPDYDV